MLQLTFTAQHLGWIAQFIADKQLWFKIKTAWQTSNKQVITVPGLTPQEVISTYSQLSSQPEGLSSRINQEIDAELLPQLVDPLGHPRSQAAGEVVAWIQSLKQSFTDQRTQRITDAIAQLDS